MTPGPALAGWAVAVIVIGGAWFGIGLLVALGLAWAAKRGDRELEDEMAARRVENVVHMRPRLSRNGHR